MKVIDFTFAVIADQVSSRAGADQVPAALTRLEQLLGGRMVLTFERTAGDEVQGRCREPAVGGGGVSPPPLPPRSSRNRLSGRARGHRRRALLAHTAGVDR